MRLTRTITTALAAVIVSGLLVAGALAASTKGTADHDDGPDDPHDSRGRHGDRRRPAGLARQPVRRACRARDERHQPRRHRARRPSRPPRKSLDNNSVALSKAIASVYGAKAGQTFLERQVHVARPHQVLRRLHRREGQEGHRRPEQGRREPEAVHRHLRDFLSGATGLPKLTVQNDLLGHVLELKGQLDDYAAGNYAKAAADYHAAYNHMFMTGDLVAAAIAKQKGLK